MIKKLTPQKGVIYVFLFIILSTIVYADFYSFESSFKPEQANFIYLIPAPNMTNDLLVLGTNCLNITGGRLAGVRCLEPLILTINFICQNNGDCFLPDTCLDSLVCGSDTTPIEIGEPITTLPRIMAIALPIAISVFFIAIAVTQAIPIVGVMGGIMLMTESWYVASFSPFIAFVIALLSFMIIILFVFWRKKNN